MLTRDRRDRGERRKSVKGLTVLRIGVANPMRPRRILDVEFLIDSGAVTLESLGVILDPFHRELRPLRMTLAGTPPQKPGRRRG